MSHIPRRYIDKHWLIYILRGSLALVVGWFALSGAMNDLPSVIAYISVFLLIMGIIDSSSALYSSVKKHGWLNSIIDAGIDIVAAVALLLVSSDNLIFQLIIIATYTFISGIIDITHGFISTVDPTDRFIRILAGICGTVMSFVILNAGGFEISTFIRFFGVYIMIVGITSLIYGVHNRAQEIEDLAARKEARKKSSKHKPTTKSK